MRKFLSQVAGIAESQVTVIEGERKIPELLKPNPSAMLPTENEIRSLDPEALFERLGSTLAYVTGFDKVTRDPISFDDWNREINVSDKAQGRALLEAGRAEKNGERLLPIRIHAFHRSQSGAWACINPHCNGRKGSPLQDPSWPFGSVHFERLDLCPECSSPLLEIKYCGRCEEISLPRSERQTTKAGNGCSPCPLTRSRTSSCPDWTR